MDLEDKIFNIISNGGDAKAIAYEALDYAYKGDFDEAQNKLNEAQNKLTAAHNTQTELIQMELNQQKVEMSLLMVHAQDHLMAAISEISLIEQLIKLTRRLHDLEKSCN